MIVFVQTDTHTVFFHNHAALKRFIDMEMYPLHVRVHAFYEQLSAKNYVLDMDNIYMSAKLCR